MRTFNYSAIKEQKWDSDVLGLIAAIYKEAGKQELYLKQRPEELEKLVEIAKIQSTEASNAIEGIVTTSTRIRQLVEEKTTPRNRDEQEIAGYRDVLSIIHESFDAIPITQNYMTDFKPYVGRKRRSGTGCVSEINDHLFEGRYSPKWPDGKKHARNVYAHTREECEEKLKTLIVEMKAEIAEAQRLKDEGKGDGRPIEGKEGKRGKKK